MPSRRAIIQEFYRSPMGRSLGEALQKLSAARSTDPFRFRGNGVAPSIVTRTDVNGFGDWSRDRTLEERVALLDDFFSKVVPLIEEHGGVYFRDEGDCIVSLFSDYFDVGASYPRTEIFCMQATGQTFGVDRLTAKTTVACGDIAFFQKLHEIGSDDWSAEGEAFVRTARLEEAVSSGQRVAFFRSDWDSHFTETNVARSDSTGPVWNVAKEPLQVSGLGKIGGWEDVVYLTPASA